MADIYLLNKPFQVLCQFQDPDGRQTLASYIDVPKVYAAGRLDFDSEGLLLLTADGAVQHAITDPKAKQSKSYWVQVEGEIDQQALQSLREGVQLKDGPTLPANAKKIQEPMIWSRNPPIRQRANIPTSWLDLTITEGRNRQIRRMTAAVGYPTLRLIRYRIAQWSLEDLQPGEWRKEITNIPVKAPETSNNDRPRRLKTGHARVRRPASRKNRRKD